MRLQIIPTANGVYLSICGDPNAFLKRTNIEKNVSISTLLPNRDDPPPQTPVNCTYMRT